jgi:hypothetical protein
MIHSELYSYFVLVNNNFLWNWIPCNKYNFPIDFNATYSSFCIFYRYISDQYSARHPYVTHQFTSLARKFSSIYSKNAWDLTSLSFICTKFRRLYPPEKLLASIAVSTSNPMNVSLRQTDWSIGVCVYPILEVCFRNSQTYRESIH